MGQKRKQRKPETARTMKPPNQSGEKGGRKQKAQTETDTQTFPNHFSLNTQIHKSQQHNKL
jgi:hypothetical protein